MPEEGVDLTEKGKLLSSEELVQIAKIFVDEGERMSYEETRNIVKICKLISFLNVIKT